MVGSDMHSASGSTTAHVRLSMTQACRAALAVTSALLLVPYMVLRHGSLGSESSLVRNKLGSRQLNASSLLSLRHLQAVRGTSLAVSSSPSGSPVTTLMPPSVREALNYSSPVSGYFVGNASQLTFQPYEYEVDLRIIVLAYNRAASLHKCLTSLNSVLFDESLVSLHVWIDRHNTTGDVDRQTYDVARKFRFTHGGYRVHIQSGHAGILSQWVNCWRPPSFKNHSREVAVILEDDMSVSRYFWRWLQGANKAYRNRNDISGFGLSHPGMEHMHATYLDIPARFSVYLYRVICTWGFAPHATSWRHFQDWFYAKEQNVSFRPLVPDILPTQWFLSELRRGRERHLWEMWHICYSHHSHPAQYTVMLNTVQEGLLAVNRHEAGLHDRGGARTDPLCRAWKATYGLYPQHPPKFGYDGVLENKAELDPKDYDDYGDSAPDGEDSVYWTLS